MSDADLPEDVLRLVQASVPSISALDLLLFMCRHDEKAWQVEEIASAVWPATIKPSAILEYLALFRVHGIVVGSPETGFQFSPDSPRLRKATEALVQAYGERPVSLIRAVTSPKGSTIQSFSDSFKIK